MILLLEQKKILLGKDEVNVTITSGLASVTESTHASELLEIADKRLYKGKNTGKNKSVMK